MYVDMVLGGNLGPWELGRGVGDVLSGGSVGVELLGLVVKLNMRLSSGAVGGHHFAPPSRVREFQLLCSLANTWYCQFFKF